MPFKWSKKVMSQCKEKWSGCLLCGRNILCQYIQLWFVTLVSHSSDLITCRTSWWLCERPWCIACARCASEYSVSSDYLTSWYTRPHVSKMYLEYYDKFYNLVHVNTVDTEALWGDLCAFSVSQALPQSCSPWCGHTDSVGMQHDVFFHFLYIGGDW